MHAVYRISVLMVALYHFIEQPKSLKIDLARSANLPTAANRAIGLCFTLRFFLFFKFSKAIPGSTGQTFTIFSPNGRYLHECCQSGSVFFIPQGTLPWKPILGKIG